MDQGRTVNKVLRDMKAFEIILEDKTGKARIFLNQIWVAGYEYYRKHEVTHNKRKVELHTLDGTKIAEYDSIEEAAKDYGCRRDAIDTCLNGRTKRTKRGHIWKYADDEKGDNRDTDTGREG